MPPGVAVGEGCAIGVIVKVMLRRMPTGVKPAGYTRLFRAGLGSGSGRSGNAVGEPPRAAGMWHGSVGCCTMAAAPLSCETMPLDADSGEPGEPKGETGETTEGARVEADGVKSAVDRQL